MRFGDWDILLFPDASHVPLQEFRTACFVVQEGKSSFSYTSRIPS